MTCNCYTFEELKKLITDSGNGVNYIVICGGTAYDVSKLVNFLVTEKGDPPNPCDFEEVKRYIEQHLEFLNVILIAETLIDFPFQSVCEAMEVMAKERITGFWEILTDGIDNDTDGIIDTDDPDIVVTVIGCFVDVRQTFKYWIDILGDKCAKFTMHTNTG